MSWDIVGKTVVLTGGTTGIGRATVRELARRGARVVFTARRPLDGDIVVREIKAALPDADVSFELLHLDDLESVQMLGAKLRSTLDRIDVLVNNAGVSLSERRLTKDEFEYMFGVNHLGHFLLVNELRPLLVKSAPSRIVIVASEAHRKGGPIDFDDLHGVAARFGVIGGLKVYGRSKLANIMFCRELARRLDGTGVTANSCHPGFVRTRLARDTEASRIGERIVWPLVGRFAKSPEEGAEEVLHLICSDELSEVTGEYFLEKSATQPHKHALDDHSAQRLWTVSASLLGVKA